jgi:CheY-like chemotaxis protein
VVDDEENIRRLLHLGLAHEGYTILEAGSGEEALEISGRHQGAIHLLITDVVLPGLYGPVLARRLNEERPDMAVVYLSGYTNDVLGEKGVVEQDVPLLQKPISIARLVEKVREVLGQEE